MVYKLDFDDIRPNHGKDCLLEFINRALALKTSKLDFFKLKISKWSFPNSTVSKWIDEAIKLNVSELDIQVRKLDLPLTCKTLTKFRLEFSQSFSSRYKPLWECPSLVTLPCLKTLDIVVHSKPFENAFKLVNGCPILENLSLEIEKRDSAEDYYLHITTLKRLTLAVRSCTSVTNQVVLNVPNLEYLCVKEASLNSLFVMKDLSPLVEAKVSCGVTNDHFLFELLKGISGAKNIFSYIQCWSQFSYPLMLPFPEFSNVKRLELMGYVGRVWILIPRILESCSELQHLCINKPFGSCWKEEPLSVPSCMVTNLKTLELTDTMGRESDLQFLKFMLANSNILKKLTVTFHNDSCLNEEGALSQDISILLRIVRFILSGNGLILQLHGLIRTEHVAVSSLKEKELKMID